MGIEFGKGKPRQIKPAILYTQEKWYRYRTRPRVMKYYSQKCAHCLQPTKTLYLQRIYRGHYFYYIPSNLVPLCRKCHYELLKHNYRGQTLLNDQSNFPHIQEYSKIQADQHISTTAPTCIFIELECIQKPTGHTKQTNTNTNYGAKGKKPAIRQILLALVEGKIIQKQSVFEIFGVFFRYFRQFSKYFQFSELYK